MSKRKAAPQGTYEWFRARWGKITMSDRAYKLMTGAAPQRNKLLDTVRRERQATESEIMDAYEKAERIGNSGPMGHGRRYEGEAISFFELTRNVSVKRPGFQAHKTWPDLVGASADFLIMKGRKPVTVGEVKCPVSRSNHLAALVRGLDPEYWSQLQGNMYVWNCDNGLYLSYSPTEEAEELKLISVPVDVDMKWRHDFNMAINSFQAHLTNGTNYEIHETHARVPSLF